MILSVSRRTDIPNYYSDWFYNRVKEGYLYVKNPMNAHQVSKIELSPDLIDCIVFWTKNPENMMKRMEELREYQYYFQFTLTGYGKDVEPNIPHKRNKMIAVFQKLSEQIGQNRVIWRYDPIFINEKYTITYHIKAFREVAESLRGYTKKVVISFLDFYTKTKRNTKHLNITDMTEQEKIELAVVMSQIASENHMTISSCAETMDLRNYGISKGSCIEKELIESIIGYSIQGKKDKNQRGQCGCIESIEVGVYHTCKNGCKYCYANFNDKKVKETVKLYDVNSPLLCGKMMPEDHLTKRMMKSLRIEQYNLF